MRAIKSMPPVLPESDVSTPCQQSRQVVVTVVARLAQLKQKRAEEGKEVAKLEQDRLAAEWFDAACAAYGKADALAEELGVDKGYLSRMRTGEVPVALRHLMVMAEKSRPAIEAFAKALCGEVDLEVSPRRLLTREQLKEEALIYVLESGPLIRSFAREVAERHGIEPEDVLVALGEK